MFDLWIKRLGPIPNKDKLVEFGIMYSELSNNGMRICPIGMVAAEYPNMPISIQENAQKLILKSEKWLEALIIEGIKTKEFKQDLNPEETSRQVIYSLSGALKMARIFKDLNRISSAQQALKEQIFF